MLLRNHAGRENHWLGVHLIGRKANIDAVGARLTYASGDSSASATRPAAEVIWRRTIRGWFSESASAAKSIGSRSNGLRRAEPNNALRIADRSLHHHRRGRRQVEVSFGIFDSREHHARSALVCWLAFGAVLLWGQSTYGNMRSQPWKLRRHLKSKKAVTPTGRDGRSRPNDDQRLHIDPGGRARVADRHWAHPPRAVRGRYTSLSSGARAREE